jgi:glutathione S-transferase
MTDSNPLIFYDISSPLQPRSYAPNPSKTRLALNFKRVPFKTTWVDIPSIASVRKSLNCPATRRLDDGSDFYTLPVLHDPTSSTTLGDTVDIANHLASAFPDSGEALFPTDVKGTGLDYESPCKDTPFYAPLSVRADAANEAYAQFNVHVDATFSANIAAFAQFLPFNPETADESKALFAKRAHLPSWDVLSVQGEARRPMLEAFEKALTSLAELYVVNGEGPYLEGQRPTYADLIVGGWLNMMSIVMPRGEWEEFRSWHGGVFARLHDVLQENYAG